jgi:heat shock protein HslJ
MKNFTYTLTRYLVALSIAFAICIVVPSVAKAGDDEPKISAKSNLANTKWLLVRTQQWGFLLHPGNDRTFTFTFADSTITLASYCNSITATFCPTTDCKLKFTGLRTTQRVCSNEAMISELEFIEILKQITDYSYIASDNKLTLKIEGDPVMILRRIDAPNRASEATANNAILR